MFEKRLIYFYSNFAPEIWKWKKEKVLKDRANIFGKMYLEI